MDSDTPHLVVATTDAGSQQILGIALHKKITSTKKLKNKQKLKSKKNNEMEQT